MAAQWTVDERQFLLSIYRECPGDGNYEAMTDELNDLFHEGLPVRTIAAVTKAWYKMTGRVISLDKRTQPIHHSEIS